MEVEIYDLERMELVHDNALVAAGYFAAKKRIMRLEGNTVWLLLYDELLSLLTIEPVKFREIFRTIPAGG